MNRVNEPEDAAIEALERMLAQLKSGRYLVRSMNVTNDARAGLCELVLEVRPCPPRASRVRP